MTKDFENIITQIQTADTRYHEDVYRFVMEALSYTQKRFKLPKHVSSEELLEGIQELLLNKFGPMTLAVLDYWGIKSTEDFGHVVFNLVENKVLSKTKEDDIEQFKNGYDFDEVFKQGYRRKLHKKVSRMKSF